MVALEATKVASAETTCMAATAITWEAMAMVKAVEASAAWATEEATLLLRLLTL